MNLDQLRVFRTIVELGSLAAAARELGVSSTTVSERLAALEAHLGVTLLNRTTRSISLTEAGRTLWEGADALLEDALALESRIRHGDQTLSGLIRLSAPRDLGRMVVAPEIDRFQHQYPEVRFDLDLADGYADIVGAGIDIAIRFGPVADSSLRVMPLGDRSRVVCASPYYIARFGRPETPTDLAVHDCILMRFGDMLDNQWDFAEGNKRRTVIVSGSRISNDGGLVRKWCVQGVGIALKSELDIAEDLSTGRLVQLLERHKAPPRPLQMLFPPSRRRPARVQAFADHLAAAIRLR
ncbi:MAG: LysR family transcriptional regulator [Pseudomonadota bacterium]